MAAAFTNSQHLDLSALGEAVNTPPGMGMELRRPHPFLINYWQFAGQ